ncbi:MAG: hypothetical protein H7Z42_22480 [Roseiflexaceae bacterium]|nr:hypothetical protein [Roseiflexaceae bacterium]
MTWQKLLMGGTAAYIITMVILGLVMYQSSPAPDSQTIRGISISSNEESGVSISGRRLDCRALPGDAAYTSRCQIEIAGQPLLIDARRSRDPSTPLESVCVASYASRPWPCIIGNDYIQPYFAHIDASQNLSAEQINELRWHYFFENVAERTYIFGGLLAALLAATGVTWNVALLLPRRSKPGQKFEKFTLLLLVWGVTWMISLVGAFVAVISFVD